MIDEFLKKGYYNDIYRKIFEFHKLNFDATTEEEWTDIINQAGEFKTPFESRLIVDVILEIERKYQIKRYNQEFQSELLKLEQEFTNNVRKLMEVYNEKEKHI